MDDTTTHYPPEASRGGDNAFLITDCVATADAMDGGKSMAAHPIHYAVCLHRAAQWMKSREGAQIEPRCSGAMTCNTCKAVNMHEKEVKEGRALFYIPRAKVHGDNLAREQASAQALITKYGFDSKDAPAPKRVKKAETVPKPDTADVSVPDFSSAVAKAISTEATKIETAKSELVAAAVKAAPKIEAAGAAIASAGMSALERARAMLAAKQS